MPAPTETVKAPAQITVTAWGDTTLVTYACELELVLHLQTETGPDGLPAMVIDESLKLTAIIDALREASTTMETARDAHTPNPNG